MTSPEPPRTPTATRRGDLQLFLNAAGRVNRPTYVAAMAVAILVMRLPAIFAPGFWHAVAALVFWPVALVAAATLTAKRLHDLGLAGWWVAFLLALVWICAGHPPADDPVGSAMAGVLGVALGLLALWPGDPRFNRFGPPPG